MKTRINIKFFSFISIISILNAQVYSKLINNTSTWYYINPSDHLSNVTFYFSLSDTLVNNKKYKRLYPGTLLVREDTINKKVYAILPSQGIYNDKLLFDFSLKVGDTLKNLWHYIYLPQTTFKEKFLNDDITLSCLQSKIVTSVDSLLVCNKYKRRIHFNNSRLIESIGYEEGFVHCLGVLCYVFNDGMYHTFNPTSGICINGNINCHVQKNPHNNFNNLFIEIKRKNDNLFIKSNDLISDIWIYDFYGRILFERHNLNNIEYILYLKNKLFIILIKSNNGQYLKKVFYEEY